MWLAASLLVRFPSSVGLQCSPSSSIMIEVQEEKSELSCGAPTLRQSVKKPLWENLHECQIPASSLQLSQECITGEWFLHQNSALNVLLVNSLHMRYLSLDKGHTKHWSWMRLFCFIFFTCQAEKQVFALLSEKYNVLIVSVLCLNLICTKSETRKFLKLALKKQKQHV